MQREVTTYSQRAAHEFESFLRGWEVEFEYDQKDGGKHIYRFEDQDDLRAFQKEGKKEMGKVLFSFLEWK